MIDNSPSARTSSLNRPNPAKHTGPWSHGECVQAASIWDRCIADHYGDDLSLAPPGLVKRTLQRIAATLTRDWTLVEYRYRHYGASFGSNQRVDAMKNFADRDARKLAGYRRDVTAQTFGDPPPGYSALDQKRSGISR